MSGKFVLLEGVIFIEVDNALIQYLVGLGRFYRQRLLLEPRREVPV